MQASMKCVKYLLFIFNLLFAVSGLALIITGGVIQAAYSQYLDFLGSQFFNTPILLIVVGCVIFFVTFFGCCGAIKENFCMTITFSVLLTCVLIVELGAGIAAYAFRNQVNDILNTNMEKGLVNYGKPDYQGVTKTWNVIQNELQCCGATDYKNWANSTFSGKNASVPDSCCLSDVQGCGVGILKKKPKEANATIYTSGCLDKFSTLVTDNVAILGAVGVVIAVLQFIGIVFSCCLARVIRSQYENV